MAALEEHSWPGNVRELRNRIKRAVIMSDHKQITAADLELSHHDDEPQEAVLNLREVRDQAERQAILRALGHVDNKVAQAAEVLGVSRPTLYDLLKKHKLKV